MDKKIIIGIIAIVIVVAISGCTENNNTNTASNEEYIGEAKAIEIFNNRDSNDDFTLHVIGAYGLPNGAVATSGSKLRYSTCGYPELDPVNSAELTDYEGKKVYQLTTGTAEGHSTFDIYIDAKTGEIL